MASNTRVNRGEVHRSDRIGWLRAAVLGANDGLISTSSLIVGVAAAGPSRAAILLAAVAGLAAGALSMAAGEYVSVSSQADTEGADLDLERGELAASPEAERAELAGLYVARGLSRELAVEVADQLMAHDALRRARPRRARHPGADPGPARSRRRWPPPAASRSGPRRPCCSRRCCPRAC